MTVYYLRDKNPMWKAAIEKMILRLSNLAVDRGDYAYFPAGSFLPGGKYAPNAPMPTGIMGEELSGRIIQGLAQYYQATGFEPALRLAGKLMNFLRYHAQYYEPGGAWLFSPIEKQWEKSWNVGSLVHGGHGHGHGIGLIIGAGIWTRRERQGDNRVCKRRLRVGEVELQFAVDRVLPRVVHAAFRRL